MTKGEFELIIISQALSMFEDQHDVSWSRYGFNINRFSDNIYLCAYLRSLAEYNNNRDLNMRQIVLKWKIRGTH